MALLQPLSLLDLVVYHKNNKAENLQRISEYKSSVSFSSIPFNIKKSSMALFITELLSKVLKEEEEQGQVFEFLHQFISHLDAAEKNFENQHLYLMIQLTHYIGFGIHTRKELERDGILQKTHTSFDSIYTAILEMNGSQLTSEIACDNLLRRDILHYLVKYYQLHVEGFKEMKSLDVLTQIFQ
jgi:DNA repair protein RecO (recombination protein O)